jgi:poly(A) polymerase
LEARFWKLPLEPIILERPEHSISRRDIHPNVLKVLYRLINANYVAYLVGGGVRDLLLGRRPKDFDVATSAHPHEIRALFRNSRLIGRRFRLVHVFFGPTNIEVATFRRRAENDDREDLLIRHDNTFGTPQEDAFRRDFTVNGLFYDPVSFRVLDYVGGIRDLNERIVRTIGEPEVRLHEDPVRMIRAVRLAAKLDFEIETTTARAIERCAGDIVRASPPRLVEELFRTLLLTNSARTLLMMERLGLLDYILPTLSHHLKRHDQELESAPTMRAIGALGEAIGTGFEPPRGFLLACLFADMHLCRTASGDSYHLAGLCSELRVRGFSRGDTELMALLLEALTHFLRPSRITRRLVRRPHFVQARRLFDLLAPMLGADPTHLDRFLEQTEHRPANRMEAPPGNLRPSRLRRRRRRQGLRDSAQHSCSQHENIAAAGASAHLLPSTDTLAAGGSSNPP